MNIDADEAARDHWLRMDIADDARADQRAEPGEQPPPYMSPRAEAVTDLGTEAARDNAIRGQIEDAHRADMTDRRRTEDF